MRIIAGTLGGRTLHAPHHLPVRPTTDYAKSGLFNILNNRVDFEELSVLDLFCGAGGISFEFASRGAKEVVAVDKYPDCIRFIQQTAKNYNLSTVRTIKADVFKLLKNPGNPYDIVFADPPFDLKDRPLLMELVRQNHWVKPGGWFILEHPSSEDELYENSSGETRRYGNCSFTFFQQPD